MTFFGVRQGGGGGYTPSTATKTGFNSETNQKNITGQFKVAAKLKAAWASPSLAAPSPK